MKKIEKTKEELLEELSLLREENSILKTLQAKEVLNKNNGEGLVDVNIALKKRETELQDDNAFLNSMVNSQENLIIFSLDVNYCYAAFSAYHKQTMKNIWGVDIKKGMNMLEAILDPADREKAKQNFDRVLKGERLRFAEEYGDAKLLRNYYDNIYSPIYDSDGQIIGLSVIVFDISESKRNSDSLLRSETKFHTLYHSTSEAVMLLNSHGFIDCNSATLKMFGISKIEEFCKLHPADVSPILQPSGEDSVTLSNHYIGVAINKGTYRFEWMHMRPETGEEFPATVLLTSMMLDGDYVLQAVVRDISDQKKIELQIATLAQRNQTILQMASDGIHILDTNGQPIEVNEAFCNMLGYTREELMQMYITDWDVKIPHEKLLEELRSVSLISAVVETRHRRKDGSVIDVEVHVVGIILEGSKYTYASARDITARKIAEYEIRKLSAALQQSPSSVVITDTNGNIEFVNKKALDITGYSIDELIGKNPRIFNSGETSKSAYTVLWNTIHSGKEWHGEFHNKKKNGELFWEAAAISPIVDAKGQIINFLAIKEDITEKKQMIADLVVAKDKAEKASQLKDSFIANMSHEIRTPLNGVLGMTGFIQDYYSKYSNSETELVFKSIETSSNRLVNTIEQMLDYSRLEVSEFPVSKTDVSVSGILHSLVTEYSLQANEKSIRINFRADTGDECVFADVKALSKAFGNIIDNAVKFTAKGSVDIVLYRNTKNSLCVDIRDAGIGISKKYLQTLFEPYSQERIGYSRPYDGLGLGLAISKKLFNLSGAAISVESKEGEGATFTICFGPQDSKEQEKLSKEIKVPQPSIPKIKTGKRISVLVVEDDTVNQLYIKSILKNSYDAVIAKDAEIAIEILNSRAFDLILMDISLNSSMDGLELTKILRSCPINKDIPIIAVTGHSLPEDERKAIEAGCDDFLRKPFKADQLLEKISNFEDK